MNDCTHFDPAQPPPPLVTGEPGSFAYRTMTTRFPAIIHNVLADHAGLYPTSIVNAVQNLYDELVQNQPIRPLETAAPDGPSWAEAWQPHQGRRWLEVPWYFAESFIYRRLVEASGYFGGREAGKWIGVDPFLPRKQIELQSEATWAVLAAALSHAVADPANDFRVLLHHCLWGNRIDLSYTKVAETAGGPIVVASEQANLLVDNTEAVLAHWQRRGGEEAMQRRRTIEIFSPASRRLLASSPPRIDFICDNAGTELLMDLALVDFLLRFEWAGQVILHVKAHPTFVSDATPADLELTLAAIKSQTAPEFVALAGRLENYEEQQRLRVQPDLFWNSSRFFWEIPPALQTQLSQAGLVIIKGDANYRRLLGDSRCWPPTIPAPQAIPYFPAPFVALRTLKSDPIVGLPPGLAEQLDQQDSEWRVNGRRGIIQFVPSSPK